MLDALNGMSFQFDWQKMGWREWYIHNMCPLNNRIKVLKMRKILQERKRKKEGKHERNGKRTILRNIAFNPIQSVNNALTRLAISNEYTHNHWNTHALSSRYKSKLDMFVVFKASGYAPCAVPSRHLFRQAGLCTTTSGRKDEHS